MKQFFYLVVKNNIRLVVKCIHEGKPLRKVEVDKIFFLFRVWFKAILVNRKPFISSVFKSDCLMFIYKLKNYFDIIFYNASYNKK